MPDPKGLEFFQKVGGELSPLSPEQQKLVDDFKGAGMDEETEGLPIEFPRIKMLHSGVTGFQFVTGDGGPVVQEFMGVILFIDKGRAWWPGKLGQGDSGGMPHCFSRDLTHPDPGGEAVQVDLEKGGDCATCDHNQWGSAVNDDGSQGKGKACKEVRRIFIIPEGHMSPHFMSLPPTSLRSLRRFLNTVRDKGLKRPQQAVTKFKCVVKESSGGAKYSELALEVAGEVPAAMFPMVLGYYETIKQMVVTAAPMSAKEFGVDSEPEPGSEG